MSALSNPQQDSCDETEKINAVAKKRSGNRRRRDPLLVNRLRLRRAEYQALHLKRFSYSNTTNSSYSSSEGAGAGTRARTGARSSTGRRLRRRARRPRNDMPAMPIMPAARAARRGISNWIRDMNLDWLECFLVALSLLVAVMVILPHGEWELIGPLRLAWHTYGFVLGCSLTTIWVLCCLAYEVTLHLGGHNN